MQNTHKRAEDYFKWINYSVRDKQLRNSDFRLLMFLKGYDVRGRHGGAWPSVATMARELHESERTVQYSLRNLENLGYVVTEKRRNTSSYYRIYIPPISAPSPEKNCTSEESNKRKFLQKPVQPTAPKPKRFNLKEKDFEPPAPDKLLNLSSNLRKSEPQNVKDILNNLDISKELREAEALRKKRASSYKNRLGFT